jgi:uncharacterized protein
VTPAAGPVPRELPLAEADAFLRGELVGRIGCHAAGLTYVVPVIYAWDGECVWVYSVEGQKVRMMRANPVVCFEVDRYDGPGRWRSVIAQGRFEELDAEGAARARALLAARFGQLAGRDVPRRPRGGGREGVAFRIRVEQLTGRSLGDEGA